ncbi:Structural maintenance of chromosomes protein 4 [Datura stramonium]|uniref:Structural maintenance of chromosomes protein 4 n=1 Tax=Datura stramonium TaxID=4076 RepID=A0ABS8VBZ7_DATST|nr:Structural maintenance of chromosomes protein 4 [Datura stramonium]
MAYTSSGACYISPELTFQASPGSPFKSTINAILRDSFSQSFSAVVGPNGSGKSNVIDAMLFVFGKRSQTMRLNKVSELIHNSSNHQNLESAGVSDDETYEAVPGSDFVITRVAFRDNSSKYYINDGQGEVEQISLMKPKGQGPHDEGFLEYLEDIIGTIKYVEKIDESFKQLEALNERRSGVVQMVKLAEKERDNLEVEARSLHNGVKNDAEAYMLKELSLLKWQEKATKLAFEDNSTRITEMQANISRQESEKRKFCSKKGDEPLYQCLEKIKENGKTLKDLESKHSKYLKRQEELDNNLRRCKDEFKEFERQDVKYREDLNHLKQKIKKLTDKIDKDSRKISDTTNECEESANLIPKLEEDIPSMQQLLVDEEKILEEIKENSKGSVLEPSACLEHEAGRVAYIEAQEQIVEIQSE